MAYPRPAAKVAAANNDDNWWQSPAPAAGSGSASPASYPPHQHQQPQQQYPQYVAAPQLQPQQPANNADYNSNYYNTQQPMASSSHQPYPHYPQQPNQQQPPQQPFQPQYNLNQPQYAQQPQSNQPTNFFNNPGIGIGMQLANQYGNQFMANNSLVQQTLHRASTFNIKQYFAVNNQYVIRKLKLILLPVLQKSWSRKYDDGSNSTFSPTADGSSNGAASGTYRLPRDDLNAPDLYIPLMSFITYVLLMGYVRGLTGAFTPEILGLQSSTTLVLLMLEVLVLKAGFWLISTNQTTIPSFLDLISYSGYKYINCIVILLLGLTLGKWPYYSGILFWGSMSAFFMMRTLGRSLVSNASAASDPYNNSAESPAVGTSRRNTFLLFVGVAQILLTYIAVRNGYIASSPGTIPLPSSIALPPAVAAVPNLQVNVGLT